VLLIQRGTLSSLILICVLSAVCGCGGGSGGSDTAPSGSSSASPSGPSLLGQAPSAPSGLSAMIEPGQAKIKWKETENTNSYNIYWSNTPGITRTTGNKISGIQSPAYTHMNLVNGINYYYVVTAENDFGESGDSIEVMTAYSDVVSINVVRPLKGDMVGSTLEIAADISSWFDIQQVTAAVDGRTSNLSAKYCSNCGPAWTGVLSIMDLSKGEHLLTLSVRDVLGNNALVSVSFIFNEKPMVVITEPIEHTVARPHLRIIASCTDDGATGCRSIRVVEGMSYTVLATGEKTIDAVVSLEGFEGQAIDLRIIGIDSANQQTFQTRRVYVESSKNMTEIAVVDGPILDVQPGRILFRDTSMGKNILKIRERSSGIDQTITDGSGIVPESGFLTPRGAIFVGAVGGDVYNSHIYDWRDGVLADLGNANDNTSLRATGNYAIYSQEWKLILRDLDSGANMTISTNAGNGSNDVASNGDVTYWSENTYQIYRYRGGVSSQLTNDISLMNTYPLTDGINVVYRKCTSCCLNNDTKRCEIGMYSSAGETILAPVQTLIPQPDYHYQVNNGWVAFTKPGTDTNYQVWVLSPLGELTQVSNFGDSSVISGLAYNGEVTFFINSRNRLYWARPGSPSVEIGSYPGKSFYQDGNWFVIIGRSLFKVKF
jgi:hypothetical protein